MWTLRDKWQFKATVTTVGRQSTNPMLGSLSGSGTLYQWNSRTSTWETYATDVSVDVSLTATVPRAKKFNPTSSAGSFAISIGVIPGGDAATLPTMQSSSTVLNGGNIKIA